MAVGHQADGIRFYDAFGKPVERAAADRRLGRWKPLRRADYPHFMLKEIHEQPAAITATVSPRVEDGTARRSASRS